MIKTFRALALLSLLLSCLMFTACPDRVRIENPSDCSSSFDAASGRSIRNSACGPKKSR